MSNIDTLEQKKSFYYTLTSLFLFWLAKNVQWIFEISARDVIYDPLPIFAVSVREIYQFGPFPPVQCCLSWWIRHCSFPILSGGRGFPIPVMSLLIVSKIVCQHIFMLSDPAVPRTFVVDCSCRLLLSYITKKCSCSQQVRENSFMTTHWTPTTRLSLFTFPEILSKSVECTKSIPMVWVDLRSSVITIQPVEDGQCFKRDGMAL